MTLHPRVCRYNTLFGVLLGLRRTQVSLHQCWALLMAHRDKLKALSQVWEIRTHMGFLIDNLQYYVQVCIQTDPVDSLELITCCVIGGCVGDTILSAAG